MYAPELIDSLEGENWLKEIRKEALSTAQEVKFPTGQQEKWRYSPIHKLRLEDYELLDRKPERPEIRNSEIALPSSNFVQINDGYLTSRTESEEYDVLHISQMGSPFEFKVGIDFFSQLNLSKRGYNVT